MTVHTRMCMLPYRPVHCIAAEGGGSTLDELSFVSPSLRILFPSSKTRVWIQPLKLFSMSSRNCGTHFLNLPRNP